VPAGNGWRWIVDGWGLFVRRPGMWILVVLVLYVISTVISWIPLLGAIALTLLSFVFAGGVMLGCAELDDGRPLELRHLFAGFGGHLGRLLLLGLLFLAAEIVLVLVAAGLGAAAIFGLTGGAAGDPDAMGQAVATVLVAVLVALALLIPILMLVWFTPALVALQELGVVDALKASFAGCLKNIVPFLLYGVVLLVLSIIAAIPLMLGFPRVLSAFAESQFKANLLVTLLLLPGWLVLSPTFVGSVRGRSTSRSASRSSQSSR
jgi:hypothetical protein